MKSWLPWCLVVATALATRLAYVALSPLDVSHDVALYLECARQLLEGKRPYLDFIDLNPPLVMYLHVPPVALASALGVNPIPVFNAIVFAASVLVLWVGRKVRPPPGIGWPLAAAWAFFVLQVGFDYGQREFLFLLGAAPFWLLRFRRWEGPEPVSKFRALLIGYFAGLGMCLKPHFLLVLLLPELVGFFTHRTARNVWEAIKRPELIGGLLAGATYLLLLAAVPAESREAFFTRYVPLVASKYHAYSQMKIAYANRTMALAALLGIAALFGRRWHRALPYAGAITLGGVLSYLLQWKGWHYHTLPAVLGCLAIVAIGLDPAARALAQRARPWLAHLPEAVAIVAWLLVLSNLAIYLRWYRDGAPRAWTTNDYLAFTRQHAAPGDAVLFLSTSAEPGFPTLVQGGFVPGSRYLFLFPIALLRSDQPADAPPSTEERRVWDEVAQDLAERKPKVLFIDHQCQACPPDFDLAEYLNQHRLVDLDDYEPAGEVLDRRVLLRRR